MAWRTPYGCMPDGTITGFADAQRAAHRDMVERSRQRQNIERRLSYEDDPVQAARLRAVMREMRPELEAAGVYMEDALDDSGLDDSLKYPPSPGRPDSDALRSQMWVTEDGEPQTSVEDQGYQSANTYYTEESPDQTCVTGGSPRLDAEMMLVDRPLPQHIFVPTWVYFARSRYPDLWKSILKHYFSNYRWPRFNHTPRWFIQACFNNGISPDKYARTPGFAPVWVFYLRDLVKDRILNRGWFQYCINEFFNNGSLPSLQDMPRELQDLCAQDDIAENDFVEVVGA